ncbi:hypothetical protein MPER_13131 [Moniliophthora perniciosa FA553]|nr:hypothetical protein MPER_13131 [Moniliophthora perniciosa FA553]
MTLLVDLHYSDTYLDGLNTKIWTYTQDVVTAFTNQGTPIQFLQQAGQGPDRVVLKIIKHLADGWKGYRSLKSSLQAVDVMVVESDWAVSCPGVTMSEPSIPVTTAGQITWVSGIRDVLASLSGGHGLGIVYWEPQWVGNANLGSSCADALLVDKNGNTRSSIMFLCMEKAVLVGQKLVEVVESGK